MDSHRKTAVILGVLFIFAIVMLFKGEVFKPVLELPDYLDNAYSDRIVVIIGVLLEFTGVRAVVITQVFTNLL